MNVKARFRFSDFGRIINCLPDRQTGVVNVYAEGMPMAYLRFGALEGLQKKTLLYNLKSEVDK